MMSKSAEKTLPPAKNLKRAFECAVRDIYQVGLTGKVSQYRTPIAGLYLCGAGAHPGGGVTGAPGHNSAHQVLRDLKKRKFREAVA